MPNISLQQPPPAALVSETTALRPHLHPEPAAPPLEASPSSYLHQYGGMEPLDEAGAPLRGPDPTPQPLASTSGDMEHYLRLELQRHQQELAPAPAPPRLSRKYLHRTTSSRVTRVQDGTIAVYVSQGGSCGKVAGAIAHALRAEGRVTVCATGQPSLLLAARALAVAQRFLERGGQALEFRPSVRSVRRRPQGHQQHEEGGGGEQQQGEDGEEGGEQQRQRWRQRQLPQGEHAAGHPEQWHLHQEETQGGEQQQLHEPPPLGQQHDRLPQPQQHGQSPHAHQQQRARHRKQHPLPRLPHQRGRHAQLLPGQQHHRHQQLPLQQQPQPRQHPQQAAGEAAAARWGKEYVLRANVMPGRRPAGGRVRPVNVAQHAGDVVEVLMKSLQRSAPVEAVAFSAGDVCVLVAAAVEAQARLRRVGHRAVVVSAGLRHPSWWSGPQGQHLVLRVQAVEA